MRRFLFLKSAAALVLTAAFAADASAALSDLAAMDKARLLFGDRAMIAKKRPPAWIFQVGVETTGCGIPLTILATGTSWELAFSDWDRQTAADAALVGGPFKGLLHFQAAAWDSEFVAGVQWVVDARPFGAEAMNPDFSAAYLAALDLDTAELVDGFHTLCAVARDAAGNLGRGPALYFRTDQRGADVRDWPVSRAGLPVAGKPALRE